MPRDTERYELREVTTAHWVIVDLAVPEGHDEQLVADIWEVDDLEYDAQWAHDRGLAEHYMSPGEALDELLSAQRPRRRMSERPVPIAHRPPLTPDAVV